MSTGHSHSGPRRISLSTSFRISVTTAIVYGLVYASLLPYAGHHRVRLEYVLIGTPQLLLSLLIVIPIVFLALTYVVAPFRISPWFSSPTGRGCSVTALICVVILSPDFSGASTLEYKLLSCLSVAAVAAWGGYIVWKDRGKTKPQVNQDNLMLGDDIFYGAIVVIILFGCVFAIATRTLTGPGEYELVESGPYKNFALVWTANDIMFLQRYDAKTSALTSETLMMKLEKDNELRMSPVLVQHP